MDVVAELTGIDVQPDDGVVVVLAQVERPPRLHLLVSTHARVGVPVYRRAHVVPALHRRRQRPLLLRRNVTHMFKFNCGGKKDSQWLILQCNHQAARYRCFPGKTGACLLI